METGDNGEDMLCVQRDVVVELKKELVSVVILLHLVVACPALVHRSAIGIVILLPV